MCAARVQATHLLVTHLLVDLQRKLTIVENFGDGKLMPICWGVRALVPCRGTGTVDGNICEAREVFGGHRMGMRCRCGILVMSWGIDGAVAGYGYRFV